MKILLFGGTSEGRVLAQWLLERQIPFLLSVATDYGAAVLPPEVPVHTGRLDQNAMADLMRAGNFTHVVDATHPYASAVTAAVAAASRKTGLPLVRLVRDGNVKGDWLTAVDAEDAAQQLLSTSGNIMLTTGSKELNCFALPGLTERCFPRVLPSRESLDRCLELGFPQKQILCMQGPFSKELNLAMIHQYQIQILVTKATGSAGGFWDKAEAAREAGIDLLVIGRPLHETGLSLSDVQKKLLEWEATA